MMSLNDRLRLGDFRLDDFMEEVISNPRDGYYARKDAFGDKGDFVTAPEIHQIFGEILGIWFLNQWKTYFSDTPVHLIELGPGRGTLMADILRATKGQMFHQDKSDLVLVEKSPYLQKKQAQLLSQFPYDFTWVSTLEEALSQRDPKPVFIIANEFFDALPVRQFRRREGVWYEKYVVKNQFIWKRAESDLPNYLFDHEWPDNEIVEFSSQSQDLALLCAQHIEATGGAMLVSDYGYTQPLWGDSLQALHGHKYCSPLRKIGCADISTHVNFYNLKQCFQGPGIRQLESQELFLKTNGIDIRMMMLLKVLSTTEKESLLRAYHRLTHPKEMGALFKVLSVVYPG